MLRDSSGPDLHCEIQGGLTPRANISGPAPMRKSITDPRCDKPGGNEQTNLCHQRTSDLRFRQVRTSNANSQRRRSLLNIIFVEWMFDSQLPFGLSA